MGVTLLFGGVQIVDEVSGQNLVDNSAPGTAVDTTTALSSSLNPSTFGQTVTFTAPVTPVSGVLVPTGAVTFLDLVTPLGASNLVSGVATLTTSALGLGSHNMTAVYGGDANFNGSTSPIMNQIVIPPVIPGPTQYKIIASRGSLWRSISRMLLACLGL
jgi:Bacterial Ig-like domain (group 3)